MIRKLTEEAWDLYLKILDIERIPGYSMELENRIYRLTDQIYYRYARRRHIWELEESERERVMAYAVNLKKW